jgi:acyl-CoA synthetase (AMP-forming)/AMP-acid ligase II
MQVKEEVMKFFGPVLYEFYGSTELGVDTVLRPEDVLRKPGSCGRAAGGVDIALLDEAGEPVPVGQPGELYVKHHAGVFDEYWKKPEATRQMRGTSTCQVEGAEIGLVASGPNVAPVSNLMCWIFPIYQTQRLLKHTQ